MGSIQIPGAPDVRVATSDRRLLLKRAGGLGLALPALGGVRLGVASAQGEDDDHDHDLGTPEGGYVGSNPNSPSTLDATPVPGEITPFARYDPLIQPVEEGPKEIRVVARDASVYVARDVAYAGWTFDGTIPGRVLRARVGDDIAFTFAVDSSASTAHSLDTHAAKTPPEKSYRTIMPGEEFTWNFTPEYPGAYMYHCGTPPVLLHIATGMYGAMIIDPAESWSPAQEICLVQSDFYFQDDPEGTALKISDYQKMLGHGIMDYVTFNGHATQYVDEPIRVAVDEPIRIFVVNAGPNVWSSFHVVGAIFDSAYLNANPENKFTGLQSMVIGPGDGACFELTLKEPGIYPAVNHAFGHAAHGAIALLQAE